MVWGDNWYPHYRHTAPRQAKDGIRARSRQGEIGKTWWSHRWIETLESYGWSNRLERGKRYARMGQVVSFKLSKGKVDSLVQGSMPKPYRINITVNTLPEAKWKVIAASMASKAIFASKLLAGEMPQNIEEAFSSSSVALFPTKKEIKAECSCPDYANPCKHIAAVYYIIAEEFDRDPFMIFLLRGQTKEELMAALRGGRKVTGERNEIKGSNTAIDANGNNTKVTRLEDCIEYFWTEPKPLGHITVSPKGPYVNAAVIKRLGEPPFWREPEDFTELMERVYQNVTSKALRLAFS